MLAPELFEAIDKAHDELSVSTLDDVQRRTAFTWAGRALVAYEFFDQTGDIRWLLDGAEYAHEALEHAALHHDPDVLDSVRPPLLHAAAHANAVFNYLAGIPGIAA